MWLIDTKTIQLQHVVHSSDHDYAILSHTWGDDELTFQDLMKGRNQHSNQDVWKKVEKTCELARGIGLDYAWIDTCCIDKTSSTELSEAINSMFSWYKDSYICFAYLSALRDEPRSGIKSDQLAKYKWFERGWTLQELIASPKITFFDENWEFLGTKQSLRHQLADITGIDTSVLRNLEVLPTIPVARRLSWVAMRRTSRPEDIAYCLLGIFDINMPLLYGEGQKAFLRLQQEIARSMNDLSLFAWERPRPSQKRVLEYRGIFARTPDEFESCGKIFTPYEKLQMKTVFTLTNRGLLFRKNSAAAGFEPPQIASSQDLFLRLDCFERSERTGDRLHWVDIHLRKIGANYVRVLQGEDYKPSSRIWRLNQDIQEDIYIATFLSDFDTEIMQTNDVVGIFYHQSLREKLEDSRLPEMPSWPSSYGQLYDAGRFASQGLQNRIYLHHFTIKLRRPEVYQFALVCGLHAQTEPWRGLKPWALIRYEEKPSHSSDHLVSNLRVFTTDEDDHEKSNPEHGTEAFPEYIFENYLDKSGRPDPDLMENDVTIEETLDGSGTARHTIRVHVDQKPPQNWKSLRHDYKYLIRLYYEER
ncbi:hypothetical protein G7054_g2158 [Neopestalotiopsis clavispora]|nr:hypothetical protein G7054_g2158 [Neopestalotiopsis clavispora]